MAEPSTGIALLITELASATAPRPDLSGMCPVYSKRVPPTPYAHSLKTKCLPITL